MSADAAKEKQIKSLPLWMILIMGGAVILRFVISHILGIVFFSSQVCDDVLMLNYAAIKGHFTEPSLYAMAKTMVFPLFLDVVSISHIPYHFWLAALYTAAALFTFRVVRKIFEKNGLALGAFCYILFMPQAFEYWTGLRIYRNAIVLPLVIILFALLAEGIFSVWFSPKKKVGPGYFLITGLVFTINYYVREDGIWLMAVFMTALLAMLLGICYQENRKKETGCLGRIGKRFLIALTSLLVFLGVTTGYKLINHHFFGVYGIETRTSGQQGGFVRRLFTIDAEGRSSIVWTPVSAIDQAFAASPTLKSLSGYREAIVFSPAAGGDMYQYPVTGERMGWLTKDALMAAGLFENEKASEELFAKVNAELDAAFAAGTLKKADRIQLLSSSGGFTLEEIGELKREMAYGFLGTVWLSGTKVGAQAPNVDERLANPEITEYAAKMTREASLTDYETRELTGLQKGLNAVLGVVNRLYGILNVLCFVISLALALIGLVGLFRRQIRGWGLAVWLCLCAFLGIGLVYLFGISWYSHFIWGQGPVDTEILQFYLPALPGIWFFAYLFACGAVSHRHSPKS